MCPWYIAVLLNLLQGPAIHDAFPFTLLIMHGRCDSERSLLDYGVCSNLFARNQRGGNWPPEISTNVFVRCSNKLQHFFPPQISVGCGPDSRYAFRHSAISLRSPNMVRTDLISATPAERLQQHHLVSTNRIDRMFFV